MQSHSYPSLQKTRKHLLALALIVASFAISTPAWAQFPETQCYHVDHGAHERNRNIDVQHMKVEVRFDVMKKTVFGKVTHTFTALQSTLDTIFFDAPGIQIKSATWDGKPLNFKIAPTGVIVYPAFTAPIALKIDRNTPVTAKKKGANTHAKAAVVSSSASPTHQIVFEYTAQPQKGIYFSGFTAANGQPLSQQRDEKEMIREQIWTQGQGIDNRHWIPMIDDRGDKYITETVVTHDSKHQVLSNGALKSKRINKDGTTTWHYAMDKPHAGYLLMLAIGEYAVQNTLSTAGTPLAFWYYPQHPEKLEPTSRYSEAIIDFLSKETGIPYPWGSYSQVMVQDFLYGAMENTSATTFGDFFWIDKRGFQDRNYVVVNAHEATHQWFGDLITGRHDGEQWLQESFATYYPGLFVGSAYGKDEMDWYFRDQMRGAIAAGKANSLPVRHSEAGSSRHYPKGASVLHMLRHVLGEDNFRRSINHYLLRHQYGTVETWDLQKAIIDETGINMDWFFDQWIHRGGEPIYQVDWQVNNLPSTNSIDAVDVLIPQFEVVVNVKQIQKQDAVVGLFKMPVDIDVLYADGSSEMRTLWIDQQQQTLRFPSFKKPVTVVFDAGIHILKSLVMKKTLDEWIWQFSHGNNMLDRYDALVALRDFPEITDNPSKAWKAKLLAMNFQSPEERKSTGGSSANPANSAFREMQAEMASQWFALFDRSSQSALSEVDRVMFAKFANSIHANVRRVVYERLPLQPAFRELFLQGLKDSSYNNVEFLVDRLWNSTPLSNDQTAVGISRTEILEAIKGEQGHLHNLKIKYLECAYQYAKSRPGNSAENDAQTYVNLLKDMAGPYYEFRTRTTAMSALKRLGYLDAQLSQNLFDAFLNFNSRLAGPAGDVIKYFAQNSANKALLLEQIRQYKTADSNATLAAQNRLFKLLQ
ncbi:MAG: M1 family peptidase [Bacteroidetes bacterium]|nr:M1 family peptidase [Bacteroidota bacterium]